MVTPRSKLHTRYFHYKYSLEALADVHGRILDVGCGNGNLILDVAQARRDLEFFGCDIDKRVLEKMSKAKEGQKFKLVVGRAERLPFKENMFNAVLMTDVLEHLVSPPKALKEIFRVLKKKGTFHLVVPCEADPATIDGWIMRLTGKNLKEKSIGHVNQFSLAQVRKMLNKSGFNEKGIKFSYHFFYQFFSTLYFVFAFLFRSGRYLYLPLYGAKEEKHSILRPAIRIGVLLTNLESWVLRDIHGQTVHITLAK